MDPPLAEPAFPEIAVPPLAPLPPYAVPVPVYPPLPALSVKLEARSEHCRWTKAVGREIRTSPREVENATTRVVDATAVYGARVSGMSISAVSEGDEGVEARRTLVRVATIGVTAD